MGGPRPPPRQAEVQKTEQQAADDRHEEDDKGSGVPQGTEPILRAGAEQHHMEPVRRTTHEGRNQAARTASEDRERHNGDLAPSHPHAERGESPRRASNRAKAPPERSCAGMPSALSRRVLAHSNCSRAGGSCGLVRHDDPSLLASDGPAGIGVGVVGHIAVEAGVPALKPDRGPAPAVPSSVSSRLTRYLQHPTSRSRPGPRRPMRHNRTRWDSIPLTGALGARRSRLGPRCGTRIRSTLGGSRASASTNSAKRARTRCSPLLPPRFRETTTTCSTLRSPSISRIILPLYRCRAPFRRMPLTGMPPCCYPQGVRHIERVN